MFGVSEPFSSSQIDLSIARIVCMCFIFRRAIFYFLSVVACVQTTPPAPLRKNGEGAPFPIFPEVGSVHRLASQFLWRERERKREANKRDQGG